ncbi:unnamed protein product [Phytophthora lilii]|uniref:Unnamed protein product n=1 Tax=Phytophthora lilii TaxID=2077276 RepID=A0A9W6TE04_9STRA|nr:unnamed protein product [Phytophthora lilii]
MFGRQALFALVSSVFAVTTVATDFSTLPPFFFHGVGGNHSNPDNFVANLTAEGGTVVALSFCETSCSYELILIQVPKAIAQIRQTVANNSVFDNGYIFLAHSQGGAVSRVRSKRWMITRSSATSFGSFSTANFFLPVYNNVNRCLPGDDQLVNMNDTLEYTSDTFGLKTLDERGGLFIHEVENVTHGCWCVDDGDCKWEPLYNDHLYAVLH